VTVQVFDVDGCLADTLPLVRQAYIWAGADASEEDVRRPWQEWLPALVEDPEIVRAQKTLIYMAMLEQDPPRRLPAGALARELMDAGEKVYAVSAAKRSVVPLVLAAVGLSDLPIIGDEVAPESRSATLTALAGTGTYYDDDLDTCARVFAETGWTAVRV
jgi:phosphoglycolate phosphatase-like HAD superfamily hydrolase